MGVTRQCACLDLQETLIHSHRRLSFSYVLYRDFAMQVCPVLCFQCFCATMILCRGYFVLGANRVKLVFSVRNVINKPTDFYT